MKPRWARGAARARPWHVWSVQALPVAAALVLAALHLLAGHLAFLDRVPRSGVLSAAGGISVAYVIVHLLPELAEHQESISAQSSAVLATVERHVYLLTLTGLAVFYGLERWCQNARGHRGTASASATAFSFVTYGAYNALIGYLLVRREGGLVLFAVAMGLHFVVNDHGLRAHHAGAYHRYGRWLVSTAVVVGALVGVTTPVPQAVIGWLLAFVGGGTILNVLKEELPDERESRFGAFAAGAAGYTAILLAV